MHFQKHVGYYSSLIGVLSLGMYLLSLSTNNKSWQLLLIIFLACFYAIWGILHHLIHHSITAKIVLEYIIIATLGVALIFFVFQTL